VQKWGEFQDLVVCGVLAHEFTATPAGFRVLESEREL
jgi:hypothetical protein